jgi:hypothetical protein
MVLSFQKRTSPVGKVIDRILTDGCCLLQHGKFFECWRLHFTSLRSSYIYNNNNNNNNNNGTDINLRSVAKGCFNETILLHYVTDNNTLALINDTIRYCGSRVNFLFCLSLLHVCCTLNKCIGKKLLPYLPRMH